jgi:hypothetical protein
MIGGLSLTTLNDTTTFSQGLKSMENFYIAATRVSLIFVL